MRGWIRFVLEEWRRLVGFPLPEDWGIVGGAIRRAFLGLPVCDFDIVVPNLKDAIERMEGKAFPLDRDRGIWRIVLNHTGVYVDVSMLRGRWRDDLSRRDFTVNAIALMGDGGVLDFFGGVNDLRRRRLRMVREENLVEDPLRCLRGYRIAICEDMGIERVTEQAMKKHFPLIEKVSGERIGLELNHLFSAPFSYRVVRRMGRLWKYLVEPASSMFGFPQGGKGVRDLWEHSWLTLKIVEELLAAGVVVRNREDYVSPWVVPLKIASLFHDIAKPDCAVVKPDGSLGFYGHEKRGACVMKDILKSRWRFSSKVTSIVFLLIKYHMWLHLLSVSKYTDRALWRVVRRVGVYLPLLVLLFLADAVASGNMLEGVMPFASELLERWDSVFLHPPPRRILNGTHIRDILGVPPGPVYSVILEEVYNRQLSGEIVSLDEALELAKKILKEYNEGVY